MSGYDTRPVLGLTTYLQQAQTGVWDVQASFLPAIYIQGVNRAGGTAMLLPPQPVDDAVIGTVLDRLDALVITGGHDVNPACYGAAAHPSTDQPGARDDWEFALVRAAVKRNLPVLGICRGAQVINVALGGTLHQHLPDVLGHDHHQLGNAVFRTSTVKVAAGTLLESILGQSAQAQCYHHQAIDRVGSGLTVSARDEADGVIEAIERAADEESATTGFLLAVQWHPEENLDDVRLFEAVVNAARTYSMERV